MKIKLFDELMRSFKVAKGFRENTDQTTAMDFSSNGEQLISCSADDTISIYNCELGLQTTQLNSKKYGVDLIHFTYDNCMAIHSSTKIDDKIRYLNLNDNKYFHYFTGHAKKVVSLSVSPNRSTFLSTSLDKTLRIWDLRLPDCQNVLYYSGRPTAAFDPDGLIFAVGISCAISGGCVKLYDSRVFGRGPFSTLILGRDKECDWIALKFSNDGKTILISGNGSVTRLIDAFFGNHLQTLAGYGNKERLPIESSFSPDSQFVFSGSSDGRIHVWNAATGHKICVLNGGHPSSVQCVKFNPKYVMLSSACSDVAFWLPTINIDVGVDEM